MMQILKKLQINIETISAIFIILFVSIFVLSNLAIGFILPIFILAMIIAFGIAFFYPQAGIYAIVFLTFIFERFFTLQPIILGRMEYKIYPLDFVFLGVILGILIQIFFKKIKPVFYKRDWLLMIFLMSVVIYFLVSAFVLKNNFELSFSTFKNYFFYALFYFAVSFSLNKKDQVKRLFGFALAGAIGIIFFIVVGLLQGEGIWSEFTPLSTEGIRTLAFTHSFYIALILIIAFVYCLIREDYFTKILYFLIPIWTVGVLGSMMRHLWIALFISFVGIFLILKNERKKFIKFTIKTGGAIFAIIIFIIYIFFLFPHAETNFKLARIFNVVNSRISSVSNVYDESTLWRGIVWKEALNEYRGHLLFGMGFGKKISVEIGNYRDFVEAKSIHNSFFSMLIQMGIAGTIFLAIFIGKELKKMLKKKDNNEFEKIFRISIFSMFIFYLVAMFFQPYLETNLLGIFFWIILGLGRVLTNLRMKK